MANWSTKSVPAKSQLLTHDPAWCSNMYLGQKSKKKKKKDWKFGCKLYFTPPTNPWILINKYVRTFAHTSWVWVLHIHTMLHLCLHHPIFTISATKLVIYISWYPHCISLFFLCLLCLSLNLITPWSPHINTCMGCNLATPFPSQAPSISLSEKC